VRILVTGATGFIGAALARWLCRRGDAVRALVRATSHTAPLQALGVELFPGDLADGDRLRAAVEGCELVFHLAGAVKALRARDFFPANADGTRRLAEACARASRPPRLIYVSSLAAAGPAGPGRPRREEDDPGPVSAYGLSKLAGEQALRALADRVEASIVRPPVVYGPGDREFVSRLEGMVRRRVVLQAGLGERRYSLVHVEDLCQGLLAVAVRGRRVGPGGSEGIYFLDDGEEHTWTEIARDACAILGRRATNLSVPIFLAVAAAAGAALGSALTRRPSILSFDKLRELRQAAWTCSSERARRELGYLPAFPLEAGLRNALGAG